MDLSKTVLIIGAGAHYDYKMPLGLCLRDSIRRTTNTRPISKHVGRKEILRWLNGNGNTDIIQWAVLAQFKSSQTEHLWDQNNLLTKIPEDIAAFTDLFARSQADSIDKFLTLKDKDLSETQKYIGKALITHYIYSAECNALNYRNLEHNWIQDFINLLVINRSADFKENHPYIFTFNYDCLLEHMLVEHLFATTGMGKLDCIKYVDELNIHHIYGSLNSHKYEDPLDVYRNLDNISVIGGDRESSRDKIQRKLLASLKQCRIVYFLGFRFWVR